MLIHTAADLTDAAQGFQPGPDYASGYGRVQVRDAVDHLRSGGWLVGQVTHGTEGSYPLDVPADTASVKVTLVWDDVPAAENAARALVNDLDLIVTDPDGTRHFPWTLDPANPAAPAVRTAADHVNVVEQVWVNAGVRPGRWNLTVAGRQVPSGGAQKFTLLYSPATTPGVPLLALESATSSDTAAGNGNGVLDPGEEIQETLVLRNTDGPTAVNVTARLSTDSPYVHLLADTAAYADLRPGAAAGNLTPLRYRVSKEAPCGHAFQLRVVATVGEVSFQRELPRVVGRLEVINVAQEVFVASAGPRPIPDGGTLRAPLVIDREGVVKDLQVEVRLDHTWLDDLRVTLEHPDGTGVELLPEGVFFGQNLGRGACGPDVVWTRFDDAAAVPITSGVAPLAGTFRPYQPLAALLERALPGEWELVIADVNAEDVGTLLCWQMHVEFAEQGYRCEPFNRPPVALDQTAVFYRNRPGIVVLGGHDPDEDPVLFGLATPPLHGTLEDWDPLAGTVRYVPAPGYEGPDQFTFELEDGLARSAPATVILEVRPATADLTVRQRVSPRNPWHGQVFTVTVTVTNLGPNQAQSGVITNLVPPASNCSPPSSAPGRSPFMTLPSSGSSTRCPRAAAPCSPGPGGRSLRAPTPTASWSCPARSSPRRKTTSLRSSSVWSRRPTSPSPTRPRRTRRPSGNRSN
ncbi:MAG: proprotein convertase P-domain-containing protein [Verrucomicrobia bacterium]|nr:proprotein convertase P-domain-containing protein [Verrucomicrobiota bacterium]